MVADLPLDSSGGSAADKGSLDSTLTDLLEDIDVEKLEEIMEELLPMEGVSQAAAALAMSTGAAGSKDDLKTDKGDDTASLDYLDYHNTPEAAAASATGGDDQFAVEEDAYEEVATFDQQDETEYFGNSV